MNERKLGIMDLPQEIFSGLKNYPIIGQDEALRFVSVGIAKHFFGQKFGHILLIGPSGTGKTEIMRATENLYTTLSPFEKYRVVVYIPATSLEKSPTETFFRSIDEKARMVLGEDITEESLKEYMEHATICLDEVDKIRAYTIENAPNPEGVKVQEAVLTLMEGQKYVYDTNIKGKPTRLNLDTSNLFFIAAGAFEKLYEDLRRSVIDRERGKKSFLEIIQDYRGDTIDLVDTFPFKDYLKLEHFTAYGMRPQLMGRFGNRVVMNRLNKENLARIFIEAKDSIFKLSKEYFENIGIKLRITDMALQLIAEKARVNTTIGARALKEVYQKIVNPYEFAPMSKAQSIDGELQLVIDENAVIESFPEMRQYVEEKVSIRRI